MKPLVVPASSANMFYATCATTVVVWAAKQFAHVDIPNEVAAALAGLFTLVVGHLTTDTPPAPVAREAVADAAADAEMDASEKRGHVPPRELPPRP